MGYSDEYRRQMCKKYMADGFNAFKLKVGQNLEADRHRCKLVREEIGWDNKLVTFLRLLEDSFRYYCTKSIIRCLIV